MEKIKLILVFIFIFNVNVFADYLLIPMDDTQNDHLKAYGLAYWTLTDKCSIKKIYWLLNYKCGSFLIPFNEDVKKESLLRGVTAETIDEQELNSIYAEISEANMTKITLEKAPKIAVYVPHSNDPWDDAVTLVLTYAEIPYVKVYDREIIDGILSKYDWLHLHHEDFTGQFDKFYKSFKNAKWYIEKVAEFTKFALENGFSSVREEKLAVAKKIKEYVNNGGFLFAMCSAPESLDVALSLEGVDYISEEIDGTPLDPDFMEKIDYSKTLAFTNFKVFSDPFYNPKSDIDGNLVNTRQRKKAVDFELFEFSAKYDQISTMLVQNHKSIVKGFFGLTTSFNKDKLKKNIVILGKCLGVDRVKYIHGNYGKGTFTFLGGHDPEDYAHLVGAEPTNLSLHKNSPGYRLILNNILFPAAKFKKLKT